jgi:hypothetical protein
MDPVANWSELTPEQKRDERFKRWLEAPHIEFKNREAAKEYGKY